MEYATFKLYLISSLCCWRAHSADRQRREGLGFKYNRLYDELTQSCWHFIAQEEECVDHPLTIMSLETFKKFLVVGLKFNNSYLLNNNNKKNFRCVINIKQLNSVKQFKFF